MLPRGLVFGCKQLTPPIGTSNIQSGVRRAARVKCKTSMENRPWSDFPCRVKNQERSLGQGELEGLWMSVVMSDKGTPEDGGRRQ